MTEERNDIDVRLIDYYLDVDVSPSQPEEN